MARLLTDDARKAGRLAGRAGLVVRSAAGTFEGASLLPPLDSESAEPNEVGDVQVDRRSSDRG